MTGCIPSASPRWSHSPTPIPTLGSSVPTPSPAPRCGVQVSLSSDRCSLAEKRRGSTWSNKTFLFGNHSTVMYRSDIVRGTDPFYTASSVFFDTDAALRILADNDFGFIHQVLSYLRVHPGSITARTSGYSPVAADQHDRGAQPRREFHEPRRAPPASQVRRALVLRRPRPATTRRALLEARRRVLGVSASVPVGGGAGTAAAPSVGGRGSSGGDRTRLPGGPAAPAPTAVAPTVDSPTWRAGVRVTTKSVALARRLLHRGAWELYIARVITRRWLLDRVCSPRRRQQLLRESVSFEDGPDTCFTIAAPVGIEPRFGYLVRGRSTVIEDALMGSECVREPELRHAFSGVPSLLQLAADERRKQVLTGPLISLRHTFGSIYYDAVVDCIGVLAFLDELSELADVPIVIGANLRDTKVMTSIVEAGVIDDDRLIVQGDRWLASDVSISFVLHDPLSERSLRRTAAYIARAVSSPVPSSSRTKLFVASGAHARWPSTAERVRTHHRARATGFRGHRSRPPELDGPVPPVSSGNACRRRAQRSAHEHPLPRARSHVPAGAHTATARRRRLQDDGGRARLLVQQARGCGPTLGAGIGPGFVVDIEQLLKTVDAWEDSAV